MRDEILGQCAAAMPLDGVLLGLHGAMVAYGYDDVEGDIIERVRAIVGPGCVIGVELDPHCHLTKKRVAGADIIILYKEFPHTDVVERAEEVLDLVLRTIRERDPPGHVAVRLPADRLLPDHAAADARLRRPDERDGGAGRRAVGLHRPLLPLCGRAGDERAHPGGHRWRQGEGGPARDRDRRRSSSPCAAGPRRITSSRTQAITTALGAQRAPDRHGRPGRQCRRRRAERQHHHPAPA